MTINFPDEQTVINRAKTDFQNELPSSNPFPRTHWVSAVITSIALVMHGFYDMLQKQFLPNMFLQTAFDIDFITFICELIGIDRNASTQSTGYFDATGTATTVIPAGTQFQSSGSIDIITQSDATIALNTITLTNALNTVPSAGDKLEVFAYPNAKGYRFL